MALLHHRIYGERADMTPLYIMHGIFGMSDNWHYHAGLFSQNFKVVCSDARNHGKSFHDDQMNFETMATDLKQLCDALGHSKINLMGHSMGGKTAMVFAGLYPEMLEHLIIVDIANKTYPAGHTLYFEAFENLPLETFQNRAEADKAFEPYAPDAAVRQFLLKNLEVMPNGGYKSKPNIAALRAHYAEIIGKVTLPEPCFDGKTLIVRGSNSGYVQDADLPKLQREFPKMELKTIEKAGHWVHADNPGGFYEVVMNFINSD